jgi:hypothetical protein
MMMMMKFAVMITLCTIPPSCCNKGGGSEYIPIHTNYKDTYHHPLLAAHHQWEHGVVAVSSQLSSCQDRHVREERQNKLLEGEGRVCHHAS